MATGSTREVLDLLEARAPTLGSGRLLCVDGPAGSGKTTLAAGVREHRPTARVLHMDDLYAGWGGLPRVDVQLATLLHPLARGRAGRYRRWDWHSDAWAEEVLVEPCPLLVLEGVGSGSRVTEGLATVLVWVEAPHDLRMQRGLARDGDAFAPHWERWAESERTHFAAHRTRERADLLVDGRGGRG